MNALVRVTGLDLHFSAMQKNRGVAAVQPAARDCPPDNPILAGSSLVCADNKKERRCLSFCGAPEHSIIEPFTCSKVTVLLLCFLLVGYPRNTARR